MEQLTLTPRENIERLFNHEVLEYFPHLCSDTFPLCDDLVERPMDHTGRDAWGCNWISCPASLGITHPDTSDLKFEEISEWREKANIPDVDALDLSGMAFYLDGVTDEMRKDKIVQYISLNGIFERSHILMGFEAALTEFFENPDEYAKMLEAFADYKIKLFKKVYELYQPELLLYHDDQATQQGQFFPTQYYADYIYPQYKRIVEAARNIGYKYVVHHTCGRFEDLIPHWLACGFDGLDSLMPCNNLVEIKKKYGDKLIFMPGGDCQHVLGVEGIGKDKIEEMILDYYNKLGHDGKGLVMDTDVCYSLNPQNEEIALEVQMKHRKAYIDAVKVGKPYHR